MAAEIKIISNNNHLAEALASVPGITFNDNSKLAIIDTKDSVEVGKSKLKKPISLKELINAIFQESIPEEVTLNSFMLYPKLRVIKADGKELQLTEKENELLLALGNSHNFTANKNELLKSIWGVSEQVETKTLETHISRLRQKLEAFGVKAEFITEGDDIRFS